MRTLSFIFLNVALGCVGVFLLFYVPLLFCFEKYNRRTYPFAMGIGALAFVNAMIIAVLDWAVLKHSSFVGNKRQLFSVIAVAAVICGVLPLIMTATAPLMFQFYETQCTELGASGLISAVRRGDVAEVRRILDRSPDLIRSEYRGDTPLVWAVGNGNREVAQVLLGRGASPNVAGRGRADGTNLVNAVHCGTDMVELLLRYGARVNSTDEGGWNALHHLVSRTEDMSGTEVRQMTLLLVRNGIDPTLKSNAGESAIEYISNRKSSQVLSELRVILMVVAEDQARNRSKYTNWEEILSRGGKGAAAEAPG